MNRGSWGADTFNFRGLWRRRWDVLKDEGATDRSLRLYLQKRERRWGKGERQKQEHPLILYYLWLVLIASVHSYSLQSDTELINYLEGSSEQQRCFLVPSAAVEKKLLRQYMEVVVPPPETMLWWNFKEEQQLQTTSSLIPSSCHTCKHSCPATQRQQNVKMLHYLSADVLVTKTKLSYLVCWHF